MNKENKNEKGGQAAPKDYKPRLRTAYDATVAPALVKQLGLPSTMAAPRLTKIVINMGVTEAKENAQAIDQAKEDLALIAGQAPQVRKAKKSISNFKLREGMPIGVRVTLRGARMYEFLDRFVSIAVPRIRDFQGFDPRIFDGRGNMNIGLKEHHIFPEISMEKSPKAWGMNITFVTTAGEDSRGKALLENMGMPFKKPKEQKA
ncbi:MAG: large subunit ribosomal protein L5 [Elusimicrobia bacterium]|nr:MAG: large subunit ribosomal protein L5 [Elusimicrobiota bacterium]KAF0157503.1 MAG: large subunit ribosomal protein L5 [Elusimicrobiota bacterium]